MKITFDPNKSYFKCFDESRGVAMNKKYVLKNKKANVFTYTDYMFCIILLSFCLGAVCLFMNNHYKFALSASFVFFGLLFLSVSLISTYYMCHYRRKSSQLEILFDKEGITNCSYYGIKMMFSWDKIEAIVLKKNSATILTDTPVYFYFDKEQEEKLLKIVKKYKKDILIIEDKSWI